MPEGVPFFALLPLALASGQRGLDYSLAADGSYSVSVEGAPWLLSGPTFFTADGTRFSSDDGSLTLASIADVSGDDAQLGAYIGSAATWTNADGLNMCTTIRQHTGNQTLSFVSHFPNGVRSTGARATDWNSLLTSFPSFVMGPKGAVMGPPPAHDETTLGYLTFSGRFIEASRAGAWDGPGGGDLPQGAAAGPYALFDRSLGTSVVLSPLDTFMDSSFNPEPLSRGGKAYSAGLMGSIASLPANHTSRFVLHLGGQPGSAYPGVAGAVKAWGDTMLAAYGKDSAATRAADLTLRTLGYSTDNGAFYYRGPEKGSTYEQTLLEVHAYAESAGIPYSYALLDSWWYYKGEGGGVKTWEPRPDIFPNGLAAFAQKTGWAAQLHNRYWANDTTYAKANGGMYDFLIEPENSLAIPTSQAFWDDLLLNASTKYGMVVYEQDWLYNEFNGLNATRQQLGLAREWLLQMGRGAAKANATVQYCMAYARMLLQSVEIPAVSQFRASDDYGPGQSSGCGFPYCVYDIGTTSILAWALGLAPSKDNFWSTPQPGGAYGNSTEPFNALQASIAALSTGPVQPSDAVNHSDAALILTTCTAFTGTLLQPSRPSAAIDAALGVEAFGSTMAGPKAVKQHDYPVWASHTSVGGLKWAHLLVVGLAEPFSLLPAQLPLDLTDGHAEYVAWRSFPSNRTRTAQPFSVGSVGADARSRAASPAFANPTPLQLEPCNYSDFGLFHLAPVLLQMSNAKLALLGEAAKVVPVSVHRFAEVAVQPTDVTVTLRGDPGEAVTLEFAMAPSGSGTWDVSTVQCVIGAGGRATAVLLAGTCASSAPVSDLAPEPFSWIHGAVPAPGGAPHASSDPLVALQWSPSVNRSTLQIYSTAPTGFEVEAGAKSFKGLSSLTRPATAVQPMDVVVSGAGRVRLDFGTERAAWLELDSADLADAMLPFLTLSVSEYTYPWQGKTQTPIKYNATREALRAGAARAEEGQPARQPVAAASSTYRLEPNDELYEGVRYGWVEFAPPPGVDVAPWTISDVRLVARVKPVNYTGSYSASDALLAKVWHQGAYAARLNMNADSFGSILMERGDRGDGHPTMAAALSAFGREAMPLVATMLNATDSGCAGCHVVDDTIMAYPVYWTMSVNDYFWASADTALFARFVPDMQHILDSAAAQFWPTNPTLVWMGWDDRLANGWCGTCNEEAQLSFATLLVRAHTDFSRSLMHAGLAALGTQYAATAAKLADVLKRVDSPTERPHHRQPALDPDWAKAYGLHAAANAINAELTSPSEALDLVRRELNDTTTLCSWSPFNQYWNLQALGNAGLMEHALASVRLCWGTQLAMSTGCFLELWNPEWAELLPFGAKTPTRPSYCHPWSSGVTHWLTEAHVGLRPLEPGYRSLLATPHVSPSNPNVAGSVDTPSGPIALEARWRRAGDEADGTGAEGVATGGAIIEVSLDSPVPVLLGLPLTHALPRGGCTLQGFRRGDAAVASKPSAQPPPPTSDATPHPDQPDDPLELRHLDEVLKAAPTQTTVGRLHANVASSLGYSSLISAGRRTVQAVYMGCSAPATPAPSPSPPPLRAEAAARPAEYPPFPPAVWRTNGTLDRTTRGNWVSRGLGKAGYVLFGFDNGTDVSKLPSWCTNVSAASHGFPSGYTPLPRAFHGYAPAEGDATFLQPPPGRADPRRALGAVGAQCSDGCQGALLDVNVTTPATTPARQYALSLYMVGLSPQTDGPGHPAVQAIRALDLKRMEPIAKVPLVTEYEGGVLWRLVYDRGVRLRLMPVFGGVSVSAVFLDEL